MYALRDYQSECLDAVQEARLRGDNRQLIVLPTGSGKAVLLAYMHKLLPGKTLVVVHREELITQLVEKMVRVNPGLFVGVERADDHASPYADIVVCSVQTLGRSTTNRRNKFKEFKKIFIDEAHHAVASTYRNILKHYGVPCDGKDFSTPEDFLLAGVTATPRRSDNKGLDHVFTIVSYFRTLQEMIQDGWLADIRCERIYSETDLEDVKLVAGEYKEDELSKRVNTDYRNSLIVNSYLARIRDKKTLVFCTNVKHTQDVTDLFYRSGVEAEMVVGETPTLTRKAIIKRFKKGETKVLVGCQVFTEGFDVPDIEAIIMGRPTKSQNVYIQMLGRGLRTSCDLPIDSTAEERKDIIASSYKPYLTLIDVVDNSKNNSPIMLPVIFGLDKSIELRERKISDVVAEIKKENIPIKEITDVEQLQKQALKKEVVEDFFEDKGTPKEIQKLTKLAWVGTGENEYRIKPADYETITLRENALGHWDATIVTTGEEYETGRVEPTEPVVRKVTERRLETLIQRADRYIEKSYPNKMGLLLRNVKWRGDPATQKQIDLLTRNGLKVREEPGGKFSYEDKHGYVPLTKGEAGRLISEQFARWKNAKQRG